MAPCGAFVVKSPSPARSSALAASADSKGSLFGQCIAAAALSLVIFANPAPSLADGMLSCILYHVLR